MQDDPFDILPLGGGSSAGHADDRHGSVADDERRREWAP